MKSRLGREAFYSLWCGLVYSFSQWLLLKLLFIYVGTSAAGWYAYAMAVIAPIMAFGGCGLRAILATDAEGQYSLSSYFTFRLITTVVSIGSAITVYLFIVPPKHIADEFLGAFVWLCVYRGAEWFSDLAQGEYQRQGRMKIVLATFLFKLLLGLGAFAAVLVVFHRINYAFLSMALVTVIVLLGYELKAHRLLTPLRIHFDWAALAEIFRLAIPVGVILLLGALQGSIPRYILERYASIQDLGVFAALVYLGVFGGFFSTAISNAMTPILSEHWARRRFDAFRKLLLIILFVDVVIAALMLIVFVFFGYILLRLMFNNEVAGHQALLPFVAGISLVSFWDAHLGCALAVLRRFKIQMAVQVTRVIIILPLAVLLIDHWGILGALAACAAFPFSSIIGYSVIILRDFREAKRDFMTITPASHPC